MLAIADAVLGSHCKCFRIGGLAGEVSQERQQALHQDDDLYPFRIPGVEFQEAQCGPSPISRLRTARLGRVDSHWTGRNGGRAHGTAATLQAVMGAGSVFFILDYRWRWRQSHRTPRAGLINTYALGWFTTGRKPILVSTKRHC